VQLKDVDREIRLAWERRHKVGNAATATRIDELLDKRLQLQAPAPYWGRCRSCMDAAGCLPSVCVIVPALDINREVVELVRCPRCDTARCKACGGNITDDRSTRCPSCSAVL
jgi:hypothetical protein